MCGGGRGRGSRARVESGTGGDCSLFSSGGIISLAGKVEDCAEKTEKIFYLFFLLFSDWFMSVKDPSKLTGLNNQSETRTLHDIFTQDCPPLLSLLERSLIESSENRELIIISSLQTCPWGPIVSAE